MERLGLSGADALARPEASGRRYTGIAGFKATSLEDRWIVSRFNSVGKGVNESLAAYRFDEAANSIYDFFWGEFCDWYLELIKPRLVPERDGARTAAANLVLLFEASLRLLHPVMPFITEEIWQAMYGGDAPLKSLALAQYPEAEHRQIDQDAETEMAILQDLIVSIRNLRAELKVEPRVKAPVEVFTSDAAVRALIEQNREAIENDRQANVDSLSFASSPLAKLPNTRSTARFDVRLVYEKKIDTTVECERLKKELEKIEKGISSGQRQLGNEQFLAKAPANVVEGLRKQQQELAVLQEKTRSKLSELGCG
jgi:valyl-tRNA synthetase